MRVMTRFLSWRILLCVSCTILLLVIALCVEMAGMQCVHAAGGSANFSLAPASSDPANPLTQAYFIFNTSSAAFVPSHVRVTNTGTVRGIVDLYPVDALTSSGGGLAYHQRKERSRDVGGWVTLSSVSLALNPGQSQSVAFGLFVPRGARAGQHVGGIVAENAARDASSDSDTSSAAKRGAVRINLSLQKLFVIPIVVNVAGGVSERLQASGAHFDSASPYQRIVIGLTNPGDMIVYPTGSATITDSHGRVVQHNLLTIHAFLPLTSIQYPLNIEEKALPVGMYSVRLLLNYGKRMPHTLDATFFVRVRNTGKSLVTLASQVAVAGPTDFLGSLALWQYALAGIALVLVGSALLFWIQKACAMVINAQQKERSHKG